jgi:hypothetical protein
MSMVCLSLLSYQELSRLEQADHMAWSLGQEEALLKKVENQVLHPAMAAFNLWGGVVILYRRQRLLPAPGRPGRRFLLGFVSGRSPAPSFTSSDSSPPFSIGNTNCNGFSSTFSTV